MKKKLLIPTILLTHMLLSTACVSTHSTNTHNVSSNPATINPATVETTTTYTQDPIITQVTSVNNNHTPSPSTDAGIAHQLPTIQGNSITIIENGNVGFDFPQYRGKIVIFEIFGKDCEYCAEEMPIINRIKNEFSSDVVVVAIQAQDRMSPSIASNILRQHHINYPVIEGDDAKDILRFLSETYAWRGILPYTLLIKNGSTEYTFPDGGVGYQELKESVQNLL